MEDSQLSTTLDTAKEKISSKEFWKHFGSLFDCSVATVADVNILLQDIKFERQFERHVKFRIAAFHLPPGSKNVRTKLTYLNN